MAVREFSVVQLTISINLFMRLWIWRAQAISIRIELKSFLIFMNWKRVERIMYIGSISGTMELLFSIEILFYWFFFIVRFYWMECRDLMTLVRTYDFIYPNIILEYHFTFASDPSAKLGWIDCATDSNKTNNNSKWAVHSNCALHTKLYIHIWVNLWLCLNAIGSRAVIQSVVAQKSHTLRICFISKKNFAS